MASTEQRIRKLEEQVTAIFVILDANKTANIEEMQQKAIDAAVAKVKLDAEQKRIQAKDKLFYVLLVPIILLVVSAIVSWLFKFL